MFFGKTRFKRMATRKTTATQFSAKTVVTTVSYTHLDVYKRQAYNKPPVELVVADFRNGSIFWSRITRRKLMTGFVSIMNPMG